MILVLNGSAHEVSTADRLNEGKRYPTESQPIRAAPVRISI